MPPRRRLIPLLALLGLSLVALQHRSRVQRLLYGIAEAKMTGRVAPELPAGLKALNVQGAQTLALSSLRGKVVLLHFWTFGCSNCKRMLGKYSEWERTLGGKGLRVVGVHTGEFDYERDEKQVADFLKKEGITWPVVLDPEYAAWGRFDVKVWPTIVIIDREGTIKHVYQGDDHAPEIESDLRAVLGS